MGCSYDNKVHGCQDDNVKLVLRFCWCGLESRCDERLDDETKGRLHEDKDEGRLALMMGPW